MSDPVYHALFVVVRWLHIVAGMLIVGGAFFYEFVLPRALEDLKVEHQLAVFGKVRFAFRAVVFLGALLLILSGAAQAWQLQGLPAGYAQSQTPAYWTNDGRFPMNITLAGWWCVAHLGLGLFTLFYALKLSFSHKMPPMSRMRFNFVILLIAVFLGDVTRHTRVTANEQRTSDLIQRLQPNGAQP